MVTIITSALHIIIVAQLEIIRHLIHLHRIMKSDVSDYSVLLAHSRILKEISDLIERSLE